MLAIWRGDALQSSGSGGVEVAQQSSAGRPRQRPPVPASHRATQHPELEGTHKIQLLTLQGTASRIPSPA